MFASACIVMTEHQRCSLTKHWNNAATLAPHFFGLLCMQRILVFRSVLPCRLDRLGLLRFGLPPKI
jgi:hypothetical protein